MKRYYLSALITYLDNRLPDISFNSSKIIRSIVENFKAVILKKSIKFQKLMGIRIREVNRG